jgi:protein-tyrosine phosphatase
MATDAESLPIFTLQREAPGSLSMMACPRPGPRLNSDLRRLGDLGVALVVSLLAEDEEAVLGLAEESHKARSLGIEFARLPTADLGVPEGAPTVSLARHVMDRLADGAQVVVHCRMGIGRSSVFAAAVLVGEGIAADEAWRRIRAARGVPVPETAEQRAFIASLAAR